MIASDRKAGTTNSIIISPIKLPDLDLPGFSSSEITKLPMPVQPNGSMRQGSIFLVRAENPEKAKEDPRPVANVSAEIPVEKREALKKTFEAAIGEILRLNPDAKGAYKADSVKVLIVDDIKVAWRGIAAQTGQNPIPGADLCAFTLTMGDKNAKPLKLTSVILLDKGVLDSVPHGVEVINHELRHVIDNTDRAKRAGGFGTTNERESYAYSKTVEDLTKIKQAWTKEGKDPAQIKILEERIAAQAKLAEDYKKRK